MTQPPQPGNPAQPPDLPRKRSRTNLALAVAAGVFVIGIAVALLILKPWDDSVAEPTDADSPSDVVDRYLALLDSWPADAFSTQEDTLRTYESVLPFMCAALTEELGEFIEQEREADPAEWTDAPIPEYVYDMSREVDESSDIDGDTATVRATVEYDTVVWEDYDWDDPDLVVDEIEVIRVSDDLVIELERENGVWLICDRDAWLDF